MKSGSSVDPTDLSMIFRLLTFFGYELYAYWQQYYHILILLGLTVIVVHRLQNSRVWASVGSNSRGRTGSGEHGD